MRKLLDIDEWREANGYDTSKAATVIEDLEYALYQSRYMYDRLYAEAKEKQEAMRAEGKKNAYVDPPQDMVDLYALRERQAKIALAALYQWQLRD